MCEAARCTVCHDADAPSGDLDLATDPYSAIVGVASSLYPGRTLVVEGDPEASFLYVKVVGGQDATEGDAMPPSSGLSAADAEIVRAWIAAGASSECGTPDTGAGRYHPDGWDAPTAHGLAAKLQDDDCTTCHGADLSGGDVGVSCDTCHEASWRTDCTFCHGGVDNTTGAPPEDIRDVLDASATSFPPHTTHVELTELKVALDCTECHAKPTDIFSSGHIFVGDTTPGVADVLFSGGLSPTAHWDGATCSSNYCHGNGRGANGTVAATDSVGCGDCHATTGGRLSGRHGDHAEEGVRCSECHADTVDTTNTVVGVEQHVDGEVDVAFSGSGMTRSGGTCTGTCHGEEHRSRTWTGGDD